ncbi:MAG: hypothetical protein BGO21_06485 [Dyadobacter sp. 50-39]|uniref:hypothetical protein n=1 Tax=Dyadobacter sp. 50-39 TaxID=1895756 RepID=UPI00095F87CB|nr:hypothetical protein [Dyadobacter sp. 50-39]OJV12389.1 MAG: hypothetical protein BGO21_06485 [Dyadobacter sp. 50-39]
MSQENSPVNPKGEGGQLTEPPMPMHVIEQFIDNQRLTLQNEAAELRIREKELDLNAKQAEKIIDVQADLIKNQ